MDKIGDYPLPKHAAYIWHTGDGIRLGLPGFEGRRGHSVFIPLERLQPLLTDSGAVAAAGQGIVQLLQVLQARAAESNHSRRENIGTKACITQDQLERAMKAAGQGYTSAGLPKEADLKDLEGLL